MKFKIDFVTNSSSASFILYLNSTIGDFEEFREFFRRYIEFEGGQYGAGNKTEYIKEYELSQIDGYKFKVEYFTSMFNGFEDVPTYMIDLMVRSTSVNQYGGFYDDGLPKEITNVKFEIENGG